METHTTSLASQLPSSLRGSCCAANLPVTPWNELECGYQFPVFGLRAVGRKWTSWMRDERSNGLGERPGGRGVGDSDDNLLVSVQVMH